MRQALECRELLGHEDYPELLLEEEETKLATLDDPLPFSYAKLTGKHLNGQMERGTLIRLSHRRAVVELTGPLPPHTNIMLQLELEAIQDESPEVYAKVLQPVNESGLCYLIHFTSVPPGVQAQLHRLVNEEKIS